MEKGGTNEEGQTSNLTLREKEVLKRMIEGKSNWEIAGTLGISERTVKFHLGNIYSKLGVNTRVKAATLTMELSKNAPDGTGQPGG
ncbi:MAG: response regulator transcription factor [Leptospirillum sp.]